VKLAQQRGRRGESLVGVRPCRERRQRHFAGDEGQPLATVGSDAHGLGDAVEAHIADMAKQGVNRRGVLVRRTQDVITDPNDNASIGDPAAQHLLVRHPLRLPAQVTAAHADVPIGRVSKVALARVRCSRSVRGCLSVSAVSRRESISEAPRPGMLSRGVGARAPLLIAAGSVALLVAVSGRHGWHRDELYFFEAGKRLAWGYVDQPPFTPLVARVSHELFGDSLVGLRLFPVLAIGAVVLLTASMAGDLGGGGRARFLAALGAGLCPVFLGAGHLLSTATFDLLAWAILTWLVVRLLAGGDERLWLAVGAVVGIGFLNKHGMVFVVAALAIALLLGGRRGMFASPWLWAGAVVALLLALSNVAWHAANGWPVFDMSASLQDESEAVDSLVFVPSQLGMTALTGIVWLPGLWWLLRAPAGKRWRPVGVAYLLLVAVFVITAGKPYYLAGMYPVLFAAGGVWWEHRERVALPATVVVVGAVTLIMALPVLPAARAADVPVEDLEVEFGAQLGWENLVDHVETAYNSLVSRGEGAVIVTSNYGEAGAIDRFGPSRGLPEAYSPHNNYWLWGPPSTDTDQAVLVGFPRQEVEEWFSNCQLTWRFRTPYGVASEEEGRPVWACDGQRVSWTELWPQIKSYRA
jgi:4-amino-4-deoxy-L-arabinose transferase-like glycosyltransferase